MALLILLFSLLVDIDDVWTAIVPSQAGRYRDGDRSHHTGIDSERDKVGILLRAQVASISLPYLFNTYLIGLFFNNFLPTNIGATWLG